MTDIFDVDYGNKFDLNKMEALPTSSIAFVSRTAQNNGVSAYVEPVSGVAPYPAGAITVALGGSIGSTFLQKQPFYTGQNVSVLQSKTPFVIPRDVFRPAIREGAVAVIAAHNHLSEDVSPSDEDIELTRMLEETGNMVGIPLLDHVILSSLPSCEQWRSVGAKSNN